MNPYRQYPFLIAFIALACCGTALGRALPETIYSQVRDSRLDVTRAVNVQNIMLDTGMGELILEKGILYPATPVGDRSSEMVFVGKGRLVLTPPDEIEELKSLLLDVMPPARKLKPPRFTVTRRPLFSFNASSTLRRVARQSFWRRNAVSATSNRPP